MACLGLRGPTWSVPSKYLLLKVARYIYWSWSTTCTLQKRQACSLCDKLLHLYMSTTAYPDYGSFSLSKKGLQQNTPDASKQDYFRFTTLTLYGFGECALTRSPSRLGGGRPSSGRNVHPWSMMVRNKNSSTLASGSPAQPRRPAPNGSQLPWLVINWPSELMWRRGLNSSGLSQQEGSRCRETRSTTTTVSLGML